jgi:general secretion pathway protein J
MNTALHQRGFTLIELLVAMLMFSVIAVAGYHGLQSVLDTRNHLDAETRKYQALAQFFSRMESQLAQASQRRVHLPDGRVQPALLGYAAEAAGLQEAQLLFTRGGGSDAAGGWVTPQRVGYRLRDRSVELLRWDHLDQAPAGVPRVDAVLRDVREFNVRYLSPLFVWENQWAGVAANGALPKAVEVELVLAGNEKFTRLMVLP